MKLQPSAVARQVAKKVDQALVRGELSLIGWLGAAALLLALGASIVVVGFHLHGGDGELGFGTALWQTFVRTIDPGQIADDHAGMAAVGVAVTIIGLLIVSTLISLVNNRVSRRVERLQRGREDFIAEGHIAILGWSNIAGKVLEELAACDPKADVVVLAKDAPSVLEIRELLPEKVRERSDRHWPELRSGNPFDPRDLRRLAAVGKASAIIVLEQPDDDSDETTITTVLAGLDDARAVIAPKQHDNGRNATTIKTLLATVAACKSVKRDEAGAAGRVLSPHVVVQVRAPQGTAIKQLPDRVLRLGVIVTVIDSSVLSTELAAQVSRRAGLSDVYHDLLNLEGQELYLVEPPPGLATFGDAVAGMAEAVPLGLMPASCIDRPDLWPSWDAPLEDARLIVLAEGTFTPSRPVALEPSPWPLTGARPDCSSRGSRPEDFLVVGWNSTALRLLHRMAERATEGSTLRIVTQSACDDIPEAVGEFSDVVRIVEPRGVDSWLDTQPARFDHTVVLSDDGKSAADSDASVLVSLLALQTGIPRLDRRPTVVAQLRERSNKYLATPDLADDCIIADGVTANVLAQVALQPDLAAVLNQIVGPSQFTIDLADPDECPRLTGLVQFRDMTREIAAHGEIALGYRLHDRKLELNPAKNQTIDMSEVAEVVVLTRLPTGGNQASRLEPESSITQPARAAV